MRYINHLRIICSKLWKRFCWKDCVLTWIPAHQFDFRQVHLTTQQCHCTCDRNHHALENKEYCPNGFLDIREGRQSTGVHYIVNTFHKKAFLVWSDVPTTNIATLSTIADDTAVAGQRAVLHTQDIRTWSKCDCPYRRSMQAIQNQHIRLRCIRNKLLSTRSSCLNRKVEYIERKFDPKPN